MRVENRNQATAAMYAQSIMGDRIGCTESWSNSWGGISHQHLFRVKQLEISE